MTYFHQNWCSKYFVAQMMNKGVHNQEKAGIKEVIAQFSAFKGNTPEKGGE